MAQCYTSPTPNYENLICVLQLVTYSWFSGSHPSLIKQCHRVPRSCRDTATLSVGLTAENNICLAQDRKLTATWVTMLYSNPSTRHHSYGQGWQQHLSRRLPDSAHNRPQDDREQGQWPMGSGISNKIRKVRSIHVLLQIWGLQLHTDLFKESSIFKKNAIQTRFCAKRGL